MWSLPFPWIHQSPNMLFVIRLSTSLMRLVIFIRHVQSFKVTIILIFGPVGVEHRAENRDISGTSHPDTHQQDLVLRKKGWRCDPPGVLQGQNALIDNYCPCLDHCKSSCLVSLHGFCYRLKITSMSGLPVDMFLSPSCKTHMNKSTLHMWSVWRILMRGPRNQISYPDLGSICSRWQGMWLYKSFVNDHLYILFTLQKVSEDGIKLTPKVAIEDSHLVLIYFICGKQSN